MRGNCKEQQKRTRGVTLHQAWDSSGGHKKGKEDAGWTINSFIWAARLALECFPIVGISLPTSYK